MGMGVYGCHTVVWKLMGMLSLTSSVLLQRNDTLPLLDVQETALVIMLHVKDRHLLFNENLL